MSKKLVFSWFACNLLHAVGKSPLLQALFFYYSILCNCCKQFTQSKQKLLIDIGTVIWGGTWIDSTLSKGTGLFSTK